MSPKLSEASLDESVASPQGDSPQLERIIPKGLKTSVDLAGVAPVVGNVASVGAAAMSALELGYQAKRVDVHGMKTAGTELALDLVGVVPVVGNVGKGAKAASLVAKEAAVIGKEAIVTEKFLPVCANGLESCQAYSNPKDSLGALATSVAFLRKGKL